MYDIAIVGAGPGGSTAGRQLAKMGFNVCLIDRSIFPRDKPCGGGFSPRLLSEFPYVRRRSSDFINSVSHCGVIHSPNGHVVLTGRSDMIMTLRTDFDSTLFRLAIEAGACPTAPFNVVSVRINRDSVAVLSSQGKEITARAVIGADGVSSVVARQTNLNRRWPSRSVTACKVKEVPTTESDIGSRYGQDREYHLFTNVGGLPGYGWVLPKRSTVNVGLGVVASHARRLASLFSLFTRMLKRSSLISENTDLSRARGALVPTSGPIAVSFTRRCLLVGDSAGMVNPLTGGGIAYAMHAGRVAGVILGRALEHDHLEADSLMRYQQAWHREFGSAVRGQLVAQKLFTGPFAGVLFEIGNRDTELQKMAASFMSGSDGEGNKIGSIALRGLRVCLREALWQKI
ncbi:MAG: hypothetical protein C4K49_02160 [Candidatus Thorarchaeota archaeon]|nr:MAG: hypothetical protein C4K49_02160 [Candidatus Thorarchaeota archaeon]